MKKKRWSSKEKLEILLEGMRDDTVLAEVLTRHGVSQTTYYKWRDRLLGSGDKVFGQTSRSEERLRAENRRLRALVGELYSDMKKKLDLE